MEIGQLVLNKDSNKVRRFIETMGNISKMLDANSLIYRPISDGNRYITKQELSKALKVYILYLQPVITQYFVRNKSEICHRPLRVHSKG